jgi:hypothetical protein
MAGCSFRLLPRLRPRWLEHVIALALIVVAVGFLYPKALDIHRRTYTADVPTDELPTEEGFFQVQGAKGLPRARYVPRRALSYFNLQHDIGTIDWYALIARPENAVPKYFVAIDNSYQVNPAYRGEVFPLEPAGATVVAPPTFRPNAITFAVDVAAPSILVVNQNHDRDWHTDRGSVIDQGGLLAVQLEETGRYAIHLQYRPRIFYVGLAISLATLATLAWTVWLYASGRLRRTVGSSSPLVGRGGRVLLWLID